MFNLNFHKVTMQVEKNQLRKKFNFLFSVLIGILNSLQLPTDKMRKIAMIYCINNLFFISLRNFVDHFSSWTNYISNLFWINLKGNDPRGIR